MAHGEWQLTRGGEVLAILSPDGRSLVPELDGHVATEAAYTTTPAFEPVRRLFEREAELLDVDSEAENREWGAIWDELKEPGLFVESVDGRARFDILWIHFKQGRAWWWPLYNSPRTVIRNDRA
ncbi:MAG: hypothetical protein P4L84_06925 [Isosphaeraceae bacterium]|nr:hypothetical protein [Isosphaeraceae bacterium]